MRTARVTVALFVASALAVGATFAAPGPGAYAADDTEKYVMEDFRGFQGDSFKEAMELVGVEVSLKSPTGGKGKARSDWVVVSTKPVAGKTVIIGETEVTAVVRKENETVTGIKKRDTYLACLQRVKEEFPNKPNIKGGWKVTATDKVSTLTAPFRFTDESGQVNEDLTLTCSIRKKGDKLSFVDFEVL